MSKYYGNYSQYLGAQKCCNLKVKGPIGPIGPQGPTGIGQIGATGPVGNSVTGPTGRNCRGDTGPPGPNSVSTSVTSLTFSGGTNTPSISQTMPITYYSIEIPNGSTLSQITISSLPTGYQAIIFISSASGSSTIDLTSGTSGIGYYNQNTTITIINPGLTNYEKAILIIYNDGSSIYGNLTPYYPN
jgi:hypothetical protein